MGVGGRAGRKGEGNRNKKIKRNSESGVSSIQAPAVLPPQTGSNQTETNHRAEQKNRAGREAGAPRRAAPEKGPGRSYTRTPPPGRTQAEGPQARRGHSGPPPHPRPPPGERSPRTASPLLAAPAHRRPDGLRGSRQRRPALPLGPRIEIFRHTPPPPPSTAPAHSRASRPAPSGPADTDPPGPGSDARVPGEPQASQGDPAWRLRKGAVYLSASRSGPAPSPPLTSASRSPFAGADPLLSAAGRQGERRGGGSSSPSPAAGGSQRHP